MDLLDPVAATCARLHLTTQCNLRCVYCAVSDPHWQAQATTKLARSYPRQELRLNAPARRESNG